MNNKMSGFGCATPDQKQGGRGLYSPYRFRPLSLARPARIAKRNVWRFRPIDS